MIYITDNGTSYKVEGDEISRNYASGGVLTIPKNTTIAILDDSSDTITFKSSANYDTWFTATLGYLYISGELVTRDNVISKFNAVANSATGGGGGTLDCCDDILEKGDDILDKLDNISVSITDEQLEKISSAVSQTISAQLSALECTIGNVSCALDTINGEEIGGYYPIETCDLINEINGEEV